MKEPVPSNVIQGVCMKVLDLQDLKPTNKGHNKDEKKKENKKGKKTGMFTGDKIIICVAEFIGTALLLFMGCMGCITEYESITVPHYMPAVSFGLTVMIIIQVFGHISGAHLNPAVTLATVIFGIVEKSAVPVYLIGQFAGAIFGLGSLKLLMPDDYVKQSIFDPETNSTIARLGLCTTMPHAKLTTIQALGLETIITALLILICCGIWDKRNETKQDSVPLRFGFAISAIGIAAGPFTGGSMNTARSFAPAVLNGDWTDQWIYWVGPTAGAIIAVTLYHFIFALPKPKADETQEAVPLQTISSEEKA